MGVMIKEILRALRTRDSEKKGLVCDCMPSCVEPEYTVISKVQSPNNNYNDEQYGSKISIIMDTLPKQRFKRNVVRTRLDLVVSIGGTTGLFLGASLLSTVELLYFMFLRKRVIPAKSKKQIDIKEVSRGKLALKLERKNLDPSLFIRMQQRRMSNNIHVYPYIS